MSKPLVYVTREIPEKGLNILKKECRVRINLDDRDLSQEELIKRAREAEGLLTMLSNKMEERVISSFPRLKVIANYAVGYNNIDLKAATEHGIVVTNTPGVLTETTADQAWGLMMTVARRIVEADRFTRAGKFTGWAPKMMLGTDVYGKTLGIIGLGRIGKAVARRAKGFSMNVIYNKRQPISSSQENKLGVEYRAFEDLLRESDFISINAPLNDSTYHLFGKIEFSKMKNSAIIVNTGRGPIIKEKDLYKALKNGDIAGAGLDVYEREPVIYDGLLELDNVVLTPHTGSATHEARTKMAKMAASNLVAALKGNKIPNIVNREICD